jgi:glycine/D-amino acid oxidase-like deaminating enzyme
MSESIDTVIVGGGQAGLAVSYYLTQQGRAHVVLERSLQAAQSALGLVYFRYTELEGPFTGKRRS